jgi:hypothetical protein
MKKHIRILSLIGFVALAALVLMPHMAAAAQGGQVKKATGPFVYDPKPPTTITFLGTGGATSGIFSITPPSGGTVFPTGVNSAVATISVFDIEKVADENGPLDPPMPLDLNSPL